MEATCELGEFNIFHGRAEGAVDYVDVSEPGRRGELIPWKHLKRSCFEDHSRRDGNGGHFVILILRRDSTSLLAGAMGGQTYGQEKGKQEIQLIHFRKMGLPGEVFNEPRFGRFELDGNKEFGATALLSHDGL